MKKILLLISVFLCSCMSTQEYEALQEKKRLQTENQKIEDINRITRKLSKYYGGEKLLTFRLNVPDESRNQVYFFIRDIGGHVLERGGKSNFLIEFSPYPSSTVPNVSVKIIELDGITGGQVLLFHADVVGCFSRKHCKLIYSTEIPKVLYSWFREHYYHGF